VTDVAGTSGSARLEDLVPGALVRGLLTDQAVSVVASRWHGRAALTLTYRETSGRVDERLVYRDDEAGLSVEAQGAAWTFDADGSMFRLVSEARRIRMAHLFDPMLAVHLSTLDPLPHQIQAVYGEMLPRQPLRFLLADDPGAGKTIMAGLLIKELLLRGDVARCLVVAPGGLVAQWQDELADRFDLNFDIVTRDTIEAAHSANPFAERNLLIARLDHLSRNDELAARLGETDWDLIVVDEAHRMAAHWYGNEVKETRRYRLGLTLGQITRHLLLMTATPHAGKEEDFQLFLALLDPDRFEGKPRGGAAPVDVSDMMRRMLKERLLRFDGRPLFPERIASTVAFGLSEPESRLYEEVTRYVSEEMGRAERLAALGEGRRGNRVGFALTVLQRRLASSPEAIYRSLARRRARLEDRVAEERERRTRAGMAVGDTTITSGRHASTDSAGSLRELWGSSGAVGLSPLLEDLDADDDPTSYEDLEGAEAEELEEALVDDASAARTIAELETEIATLVRLEELARRLRAAGTDRKWAELSSLITEGAEMRQADGSRHKLIVFTEHRDTLNYLTERLRTLLGRPDAVVAIHGGVPREQRRYVQERFTQDPEVVVLVATDAAGEGINLQQAHLLVNYDLPWNPNRIEQRFGRIHRIGQTEVCHMWNLVAEETREGQVYLRLLDKLEEQRKALGGEVFDVLGQAFRGQPLRDLLLEAIRYGDQPAVRARLDEVIDATVGAGLAELIEAQALSADVLGMADVEAIRAQMEEAAARRLQPHYVAYFFLAAFARLGGRAVERETGRYELTHVPAELRVRSRPSDTLTPVLARYQRVCFDKELTRIPGRPLAELVCPGHALLEGVIDLLLQRHGSVLRQGTVLIDENDADEVPSTLLYLDQAICDGRLDAAGKHVVVSRRFEFVKVGPDGHHAQAGGAAPYLDLRPATEDEAVLLKPLRDAGWCSPEVEARGVEVAIAEEVPAHLAEVRARTVYRVAKVRAAVHARLSKEIEHWDRRAVELTAQTANGRQPKMNPDRAAARADELSLRRRRRMAELDAEAALTALPPVVVGAALVVPAGLLARIRGERAVEPATFARQTAIVERRAVDAVLSAEARLGRVASEMAHNHPGYDISSVGTDGHLIFIEVKGRVAGAETVTVTRNEVLTGLNAPERYVLALVEVGLNGTDTVRYLRQPFRGTDDTYFEMTSVNFTWRTMWDRAGEPS
jgi:superfamily II DNA or RNA helicase